MELYQALITLDGWTFLAQICNLMIQLLIFKKFLLNPVKKVIAERKAKADSQIADAAKLRTRSTSRTCRMPAPRPTRSLPVPRKRPPPAVKRSWARPVHRPLP